MAQDYLAIMATSASSERVFSSAKEMLGLKRGNMKPNSMEAQICLRSWLRAEIIKEGDLDFGISNLDHEEDDVPVASSSRIANSVFAEPEVCNQQQTRDILAQAMEASDIFEEIESSTEGSIVEDYVYLEICDVLDDEIILVVAPTDKNNNNEK